MKNKKFTRFVIILISIWTNMLLLSACGNQADEQKVEEENIEINTMEEADDRNEYPVYLVESIDNLHLGSEEFHIENYFIRNECQYPNHYYIDSDNVLWGYGDNEYGQLGNGLQYSRDADGEYRLEMTPQKIVENVIHVDFGGYFVIPTLAEFAKHGFQMAGLTEVKAKYTDWQTGKPAVIPAIRMVAEEA